MQEHFCHKSLHNGLQIVGKKITSMHIYSKKNSNDIYIYIYIYIYRCYFFQALQMTTVIYNTEQLRAIKNGVKHATKIDPTY